MCLCRSLHVVFFFFFYFVFFFQAEDGIRYLVRSRGLGDVYKRQVQRHGSHPAPARPDPEGYSRPWRARSTDPRGCQTVRGDFGPCLLYTSDAADERSSVDLGGRRIIKKKKHNKAALSDRPHRK